MGENCSSIKIKEKEYQLKKQIEGKCLTELASESIKKVLSLSASSSVLDSKKVKEGEFEQIALDGKITYYLCFLDNEGQIKKAQYIENFSEKFDFEDGATPNLYRAKSSVIKCSYDLSGKNIELSSFIMLNLNVTDYVSKEIYNKNDGVITQNSNIEYYKSFGIKTSNYPLEESFTLNYEVKEVIKQSAKVIVTAVQCGVGTVITDGEIIYSALLLQNVQKSDIIKEEFSIPFRMETEYEDAMPSLFPETEVSVSSLKTDISVDENSNKSDISINVILRAETEVFSLEKIDTVSDAFCVENELIIEKNESAVISPKTIYNERTEITDRVNVQEIPLGAFVMAVETENTEVLSVSTANGKPVVTGVVNFITYYKNQEGEVFSQKYQLPFEIQSNFDKSENVCVFADCIDLKVKIASQTELEVFAKFNLCIKFYSVNNVTYISNIEMGEKISGHTSPLCIYLSNPGEDLWSLSKRLRLAPESLIETNKDLQFPLSGKERIVVYRQKIKEYEKN